LVGAVALNRPEFPFALFEPSVANPNSERIYSKAAKLAKASIFAAFAFLV
jgi:hypothetical protein